PHPRARVALPVRLGPGASPGVGARPAEPFDHPKRDAGLVGRARARRDDDCVRTHLRDLRHRDLVVADHFDLRPKLAEILNQVVGEGVVVINHEQHSWGTPGVERRYRSVGLTAPERVLAPEAPMACLPLGIRARLWGQSWAWPTCL